jgi:F0F1-type ATP synthase assembly protein I
MSAQPSSKPDKPAADELPGEAVRQGANYYLRYSGMAFQMGAVILVGVWAGKKLDAWLGTAPYLLVVMALLSIFAGLYVSLKDLIAPKAKKSAGPPTNKNSSTG